MESDKRTLELARLRREYAVQAASRPPEPKHDIRPMVEGYIDINTLPPSLQGTALRIKRMAEKPRS